MPYLNEIIGKGFRLDHEPTLLTMDAGTEGVSAPTLATPTGEQL